MKKIAVLFLILTFVALVGCKGDGKSSNSNTDGTNSSTNSDDKTNSEIEFTPGISDNIFGENGVEGNIPTKPTPGIDDTVKDDEEGEQPLPDNTVKYTYKEYVKLTPAQQDAYIKSFESIKAFFDWYEKAKEEYEKNNPPIDVGDGNIDLEGILGK